MTDVAADLLRLVRYGDLSGWHGLTSCLLVTELTSTFRRESDWSGTAQLGRRHRETNYLWALVPDSNQSLRVWFETDRVILVDFAGAATVPIRPGDLAGIFAEAPTALDTWLGTLPMPKSEFVFPRHGLAVFVNRETQSIWHLALFPTLTLGEYIDNLRIDMQVRRHQPRHSGGPSA